MSVGLVDDVLAPEDAAQVASLDAVHEGLVADARGWAARLGELSALAARADRAGPQTRRTLALELAGSWKLTQHTAERWIAQAERFVEALPRTLSMLAAGTLLVHQAQVLLHDTSSCTPAVAQAVEEQVLPAGAELCPSDLRRQVARIRLRIESEQTDPADAERREAERIASRRTFARPTEDGLALAGAILTPEQGVAWAAGMDALERRERLADRAAGIRRSAQQRRADLFAALPALVLAGTTADDRWRREAGIGAGGRISAAPADGAQPLFDTAAPVPPPWSFHPDQLAARIVLNLHVPVSTVLDRSTEPGTLHGYGPVPAEHVRLLRPTLFRRVLVDSRTGRPIAVDDQSTPVDPDPDTARQQVLDLLTPAVVHDRDEPRHDPSARLARLVDLRDVRCCGPGCSSSRCDRDHLDPWPAGATSAGNLGLLSPRCHSAKHSGWTLIRHDDGSVTWRSRLRRHYQRPGPWTPPPQVDLSDDLPPRRPRPPAPPPDHDGDGEGGEQSTLLDQLQPPPAEPPPPPPESTALNGWPDDPPF